jgi:hypothetical protein
MTANSEVAAIYRPNISHLDANSLRKRTGN